MTSALPHLPSAVEPTRRLALVALVGVVGVGALLAGCPNEVPAPGCRGPSCKDDEEEAEPPRLFVDPPFGLGFDCVTIGCDVERRMIVENRGGGALTLVLARLTVDTSTDFTMRTGTGAVLPFDANSAITVTPEEPLELFVRYAPSDGTADAGEVTLDWHDATIEFDDAVLERVELPLSTRALGDAAATVAETRLNFGFVPVGGYATRSITIDNTGEGGVLEVGPVALADGTPEVFLEPGDGAWGTQFANPGESITVLVNFRPTTVGTFTGAINVRTTDGANPVISVEVAGTAIAEPVVGITGSVVGVDRIDFQSIRVGTSRTLPLRIDNTGGAPLTVRSVVQVGTGVRLSTTDAREVAPLEHTTIDVTWSPTAGGPLVGRLEVTTNDPARPSFFVDVVGFANAPRLAAAPTTVSFGSVVQGWTTEGRSFELRNDGFGELTINTIAFEVGSSSQIRFAEVPNLPVKLSPGDDPVRVTLIMEASTLGTQSATVLIGSDGIDGPLGQGGVGRVTVSGVVVDCETGCPMSNATPSCAVNNECRVGACAQRFHNPDGNASNGCECGEDPVPASPGTRRDIAGTCGSDARNLGTLNDNSNPRSVSVSGTLHAPTDVDLFFYRADDNSQFLSSDDYGARVRLVAGPPGLRLFARFVDADTGCGGENQRQGPVGVGGVLSGGGNSINDDSQDVTVWVEWAPDAQPVCGSYTVRFSADEST